MLKTLITGVLALTTVGTGATAITLSNLNTTNVDYVASIDTSISYSIPEMLTLAIQDEYEAKATYESLLVLFPEAKFLEHLIKAEQRHIDALVPLFTVYGIELPVASLDPIVVAYQTLEEAAIDIAAKEVSNIEMYKHFLAQPDLPEDVEVVFKNLMKASLRHQGAAEKVAAGLPSQGIGGKNMMRRPDFARFAYSQKPNFSAQQRAKNNR